MFPHDVHLRIRTYLLGASMEFKHRSFIAIILACATATMLMMCAAVNTWLRDLQQPMVFQAVDTGALKRVARAQSRCQPQLTK
jgi:hypothetical protein